MTTKECLEIPVPDSARKPTMSSNWKRCHLDGMKAYCQGEDISDCPGPNQWGKGLRDAWKDGFNDARKLDKKGKLAREHVLSKKHPRDF